MKPQKMSREEKVWRFWSRVERNGWGNCWKWKGYKNQKGYGKFPCPLQFGEESAHRISYLLNYGPIPHRAQILHHCDNPECTNPIHLYAGTHDDNMRDKVVRGHAVALKGTTNPLCKISDQIVRDIRRRYAGGSGYPHQPNNQVSLAKEFGVSVTAIHNILKGKSWRHVV